MTIVVISVIVSVSVIISVDVNFIGGDFIIGGY